MKRLLWKLIILVIIIQPMAVKADNNIFRIEYDGKIHTYTNRTVAILLNDNVVTTGDMPAIIIDNRTLVPAREVFEAQGINAKVDWNAKTSEVLITCKDIIIKLKINERIAYVNNKAVTLDVPAKLIRDITKANAKTMIPLRFVIETLKYEVIWNQDKYSANIKDPNYTPNIPVEPQVPVEPTQPTQPTNPTQPSNPIEPTNPTDKLDGLNGQTAKRQLPTGLFTRQVNWIASSENITNLLNLYQKTTIQKVDNLPVANIKEISRSATESLFTIKADSAISNITVLELDKKIVVDIENGNYAFNSSEYIFKDDKIVEKVRTSQFKNDPKVTRVVFDLNQDKAQYNVYLSEDRKSIHFKIYNNIVYKMDVGQDGVSDYIRIEGLTAPNASISRLSNPDRIVIDLPTTVTAIGSNSADNVMGQYINKIRTAQFSTDVTRIVLETEGQPDYQIIKEAGNTTVIRVMQPSYKNISYENVDAPVIQIQLPKGIALSNITEEDLYLNRKYKIIFPGNHLEFFGKNSIEVNDSIINKIEFVLNAQGNTEMIISTAVIKGYYLKENAGILNIKICSPTERYKKVLVVDAGHGGSDPGAVHNGLQEKNLNLKIVTYLKQLLDKDTDMKVYYTRLDDTYPTLGERAQLANEVKADLFLSVHNNALTRTDYGGTETMYSPNTLPGLDNTKFAKMCQEELVKELKLADRGIKERPGLYILKNSTVPTALVEIAYMSNPENASLLKDENFLNRSAAALERAITRAFTAYPTNR